MIGPFIRRLALLIRRRRAADDLAEEMRLHVELRAAAHRRGGLDDRAADLSARRQFGNVLRLREESQDMWGFAAFDRSVRDARHACRQLVRRPAWTATVLMTLALGIGANTSIFTVVNATLFRPAPGRDPDRLVWVAIMEGQSEHVRAGASDPCPPHVKQTRILPFHLHEGRKGHATDPVRSVLW